MAMDDVIIRHAEPADGPELARLRWQLKNEEAQAGLGYARFKKAFLTWWAEAATAGWLVVVAERDGQLVGNAWLFTVPKVPAPHDPRATMAYLTNVYVDADLRDQGVGSRLLAAARSAAEKAGHEMVVTWPSERSVTLYQRAGYVLSRDARELALG
jgi:GNAT superfamily N-acetyltransferase